MSAIIINNDKKKNFRLLADLAKELGFTVSFLSDEQVEDLALGTLMEKERTGQEVNKEEVMKKLRG